LGQVRPGRAGDQHPLPALEVGPGQDAAVQPAADAAAGAGLLPPRRRRRVGRRLMTAAVRPCNFCGSAEARLRLHGYGFDRSDERFDVYECPACGLVRVEPPPADLARYYAPEYYGSREAKFTGPLEALVRRANERRVRALLRWLPPGGSRCVLDVGCGRGLFLRALHAHGFVAVGTELPGFDFPPGHAGVHFFHAPAEALPFADAAFDAVSIWHVLEHTTDPAAALRAAARVLRPGGVLALAVPNFGSRQARWFGRHWFH